MDKIDRKYKIKVRGEDDSFEEVKVIHGTQVGPFGISHSCDDNGNYAVTHLHTGLSLHQLRGQPRECVIEACEELAEKIPFWSSSSTTVLMERNGFKNMVQFRDAVVKVAMSHGLVG